MTAQQPQNPTLRLLIAENSENEAHAFDSLLRDAGIATRTEVVDLNMALESMTEADMLLANSDLPELQQLMPNLRASAPNVPIILLNGDDASLTATAGLQMGAADVVPKSAPDHLVLVVKRELEKISQSQRLIETRRALEEAEPARAKAEHARDLLEAANRDTVVAREDGTTMAPVSCVDSGGALM